MSGSAPEPDPTLAAGAAAPPMANGELVFEYPWQGRVFGMANSLCEAGHYEWREFQAELIRVIGQGPAVDTGDYRYYDHLLGALENLLEAKGLLPRGTLDTRVAAFAARPADHDHDHAHDRDRSAAHGHAHGCAHDGAHDRSDEALLGQATHCDLLKRTGRATRRGVE